MNFVKYKKQSGAVFVEVIFALPVFFFLLFGIFEISYVYRSKSTLNVATFEAVRAGTLNNAKASVMRKTLANGMMPLFVASDKSVAGISEGFVRARAFEAKLNITAVGSVNTVNIVNPNKKMFDAFKKRIPVLNEKKTKFTYVQAIPNDNLQFRSVALKQIKIGGKNQKINLQDANLLKIKTLWCHKLKVPGLRDLVQKTILNGFLGVVLVSDEQRACNIFGATPGFKGVYVAITAHSIMRMQTPVYKNDLK